MRSQIVFLFTFLLYQTTALRTTTCPNLLQYYITNALSRVGPYGFNPFNPTPFFPFPRNPVLLSAPTQAEAPAPQARPLPQAAHVPPPTQAPPQAGVDFSETNVQVEGVDEPDIVKTDGNRVYVLRRNTFFIINVEGGGTTGKQTGNITLPTHGREMLIHEDRVLVISQDFENLDVSRSATSKTSRSLFFIPSRRSPITVIYHISINGPEPKLLSTLRMDGSYVSSREVDGIARIVLKFDPTLKLPFRYPRGRIIPGAKNTYVNKAIIRPTSIETWLPRYTLTVECSNPDCARVHKGFVTDCEQVFIPDKFSGFGLLTVATLQMLDIIKPQNSASIISDSGDVYSTASSLYVATTEYRYDFAANSIFLGRGFRTTLHKFRLDRYGATFAGSGKVFGSVLNQFSMHEHNGIFFVATTEGAPWWGGRDTSSSKVTSFRVADKTLVKIGEVGNLGIGERIFAVRYIASTAYVVTFRQIDPLYIIDLSNPSRLVVTGELKIPGFSSYLHPVSPGRILGVGQEATLQGRTTGAKVSLFDVSDVTNPKEIAGWTLKGSFTSAQFDHRAFLYWAPENVAILPVSVYTRNASERFTGSVVLNVSDELIVERGRVSHNCCGRVGTSIERNFVIGRRFLWSLSRELLQVNRITDLVVEGSVVVKGKYVSRALPGTVVF